MNLLRCSRPVYTRLLSCLSLLLTTCSLKAQLFTMPREDREVQRPMDQVQYAFSPDLKKPVKSLIYLEHRDTAQKRYFDRSGRETEQYDYASGNRLVYLYRYTYNKQGQRIAQRVLNKDGSLQRIDSIGYDKRGNMSRWKANSYTYDKKLRQQVQGKDWIWMIDWNDRNRMTRSYRGDLPKTESMLSEYVYDARGRLAEKDQEPTRILYDYQDSLPVKKYKMRRDTRQVSDSSVYAYTSEGLLARSAGYDYIRTYRYEGGRLIGLSAMKTADTTQRQDADLFYKDGLLSSIEIHYSDAGMQYATPELTLPYNMAFSWQKDKDNPIRMDFSYDSHRHVTEIRYSAGEVPLYRKFFLYEYY